MSGKTNPLTYIVPFLILIAAIYFLIQFNTDHTQPSVQKIQQQSETGLQHSSRAPDSTTQDTTVQDSAVQETQSPKIHKVSKEENIKSSYQEPLNSTSNETEKEPDATPNVIQPETPSKSTELSSKPILFSFWLGLGASYVAFNQEAESNVLAGDYSTIKVPASFMKIEINLADNLNLTAAHTDTPGTILVKPDTVIDRTNYSWKTFNTELEYTISKTIDKEIRAILGLQIHHLPFLMVNQDGSLSLIENELQNFSVGVKQVLRFENEKTYEGSIQYQIPTNAKSLNGYEFKTTSGQVLDISLGAFKKYSNGFRVGAYWNGQYLKTDYDFSTSQFSDRGTQVLYQSNIQLRIGFEL